MSPKRQFENAVTHKFVFSPDSMISLLRCILLFLTPFVAIAQVEIHSTTAIGKSEGTISLLIGKDWEFGKAKKLAAGTGVRLTTYLGANQYYTTAPAEITSGKTGPFVIFSPTIEQNIDTFLIKSPQVNSLNIFINVRYRFNEKLSVGFNIDAIGFSFGSSRRGNYINGSQGAMLNAKPTTFNALLTSDNDLGSLNSEFYGKYFFRPAWGVKLAVQFHFTEYTTEENVQKYPKPNDRFRNKSLMAALGVVYNLNK